MFIDKGYIEIIFSIVECECENLTNRASSIVDETDRVRAQVKTYSCTQGGMIFISVKIQEHNIII